MLDCKHQIVLLELLIRQRLKPVDRMITRKDMINFKYGIERLFSNDNDFFKHVIDLINFDYIEGNNHGKYYLKANGWCIANIIALQKNTDERYRKVAQEISWLP